MKLAVSIMKGIQVGGIVGAVLSVMLGGPGKPSPKFVSFEMLAVSFICAGLVASLCLAFIGERERAWKGALLTIAAVVVAVLLSAPMVIR